MKKVTDLNILKREDGEFYTGGNGRPTTPINRIKLYTMSLIEVLSLIEKGELWYQSAM